MIRRPPRSTLFPCPPLFRSPIRTRRRVGLISLLSFRLWLRNSTQACSTPTLSLGRRDRVGGRLQCLPRRVQGGAEKNRSEEHTSELQSRQYLVCRLLLEKKI